jgi:Galactose oxidase, central domain
MSNGIIAGRRARGSASFGWWVVAATLGIVVVELISFIPAGVTTGRSQQDRVAPPGSSSQTFTDSGAASALQAAAGSLGSGGGPAAGTPWGCSPAADGGGAVQCGAAPTPGSAPAILSPTPTWKHPLLAAAREYVGMAYDARDQYVLLFGGLDRAGIAFGDTWRFSGGGWTQLHPVLSPGARYGTSMAFDAADNYVLLFGGFHGSTGLRDTWKFAGGSWTKLTPTSNPGPLGYASMTYDVKGAHVVFFGGMTSAFAVQGATWEFKAGQWTNVTPTPSPPARMFSSFAYDAKDGYALLFGGNNVTFKAIGDTWNFSAGKWTKLTPSPAPSARWSAAMAFSVKDGTLVLFGGYDGAHYVSDTWTFAAGAWTKKSAVTHPTSRTNFGMADGTATTNVVLFGGVVLSGAVLNDTWTFHGTVWTHVPLRAPTARLSTAMTYDEADGYVLLFGGQSQTGPNYLNDTWKFLNGLWTPLHPARAPPARSGAGMAYDQADGYVVLFGGFSPTSGFLNDTWTFTAGTWSQVSVTVAPPVREAPSMTYDYADDYVLLFGGCYGGSFGCNNAFSDTWTFSAGVWTQVLPSASPSARDGAAMSYDSGDGYVVLFSGFSDWLGIGYTFPDTWTYSAGSWTNLTGTLTLAASPPGVTSGALVDDTYDGYLLLFGGYNQSSGFLLRETWSFNGGLWSKLAPTTSPLAEQNFGMAFDVSDNSVVLLDTGIPALTWLY